MLGPVGACPAPDVCWSRGVPGSVVLSALVSASLSFVGTGLWSGLLMRFWVGFVVVFSTEIRLVMVLFPTVSACPPHGGAPYIPAVSLAIQLSRVDDSTSVPESPDLGAQLTRGSSDMSDAMESHGNWLRRRVIVPSRFVSCGLV